MFTRSLLALLLFSQPAYALSCARPDVARSFAQADTAKEHYVLALGTFGPLAKADKRASMFPDANKAKPYRVNVPFRGKAGTRAGFTAPLQANVTVNVTCAAHWCGSPPEGQHFVFLEKRRSGYFLEAGPCPWWVFPADTADVAVACLNGLCPEPKIGR